MARILHSDPGPASHNVYVWLKDERFLVNVISSAPDR